MTILYIGETTEVVTALNDNAVSTSYYFKFTDEYRNLEYTYVAENTSDNNRYAYFSIDCEEIDFQYEGLYLGEIFNWNGSEVGTLVRKIYVNLI
jgi:hypothetical protein